MCVCCSGNAIVLVVKTQPASQPHITQLLHEAGLLAKTVQTKLFSFYKRFLKNVLASTQVFT